MAADYSNLSDEELKNLVAQKRQGTSVPSVKADYASLSDDELRKAVEQKRGAQSASILDSPIVQAATQFGKIGLQGAIKAGEFIDRYTNAPVRAAVESGDPTQLYKAIGREGVPSGAEIAAKKGLSTEVKNPFFPVSPAGVAGFALDMADPTLLLGAGKNLVKGAAKGIDVLTGGSMAARALEKATDIPLTVAAKFGSAVTGLSEDSIKNYAKRADEVEKVIKSSGGDIAGRAQEFKASVLGDLKAAKNKAGKQIEEAIGGVPGSSVASIDPKPIFEALQSAKSKLDDVYDAQAIRLIDDFEENIRKNTADGLISLQKLQNTKNYLQEHSSNVFKNSGQIFNATEPQMRKAALAANNARFEARKMLDELGPKELKEANGQLAELHRLEDGLNSIKVLSDKAHPNALFRAGSGADTRGSALLRRIEKITGRDVTQGAKDLSTARDFVSPGLLPMSSGGTTSTSRTLLGAGGIRQALQGPAALKAAIQVGRFPLVILDRIGAGKATLNDAAITGIYETLRSPSGQKILNEYLLGGEIPAENGSMKRRSERVGGNR